MSETPEVADAVLRHMYTLEAPILRADPPSPLLFIASASIHERLQEYLTRLVQFRAAAVKVRLSSILRSVLTLTRRQYGLLELADTVREILEKRLATCSHSPQSVVATASLLYATTKEEDKEECAVAITAVVTLLDAVMRNEVASTILLSHRALNRDVLKMAGILLKRNLPRVSADSITEPEEPERAVFGIPGLSRVEQRPGSSLEAAMPNRPCEESS